MLFRREQRSFDSGYCASRQGILKWIEIAFVAVALGLVAIGVHGYGGYTYIVIETAFCLAATLLLMILISVGFRWNLGNERAFNLLCFVLNAVAFGVAVYCTVVLFGDATDSRVTWHSSDWHNRMAAVSAFTAAAAIVYLYDAALARDLNMAV
jgi:hypothetical protein